MSPPRGKAYIVGAGPGDPGLITVKGLEALRLADVVVYDRLINPYLLSQSPAGAEWVYAGKAPGGGSMEQEEIDRLLVDRTREGKTVVRLKGGDPFIYARGGEEGAALASNGLEFEIVPGVTSATAVPAYAGIPLTHRGLSSSFAVITGREDTTSEWSRVAWDRLATGTGTLVIMMGIESLAETMTTLRGNGVAADTPVAVIEWGTDPRQRTVTGTLADIAEHVDEAKVGAPSIVVVGQVVRLRETLRWFDNKPLFGKRVLVTRSRGQASALSRLLEEHGAQPVELPTIDIRPPEDWGPLDSALQALSSYDWAIFTSVNPVEMVWSRLQEAGGDARCFGGVRICAIGPATARALESRGLKADFVPDRYTGEDVVTGLGRDKLRGARVLLPRSDIAPEEVILGLERSGAEVRQVHAYRTAVPEESRSKARDLLTRKAVDMATFSSSSTVHNLVDLLGRDAPALLNPVTIACIGPVTARAAERLGLGVDIIAEEHTIPGLVNAMVGAARMPQEDR